MDYKIVEMTIGSTSFFKYKHAKAEFMTSFQNEVNKLLNDGYILAGGINITQTPPGDFNFAQALIK
jgi:hypothetical protein